MKFFLLLLGCMAMASVSFAQYVYTINADSVKITSHCDSAELIIQNHTQGITGGVLYNTGNGRTIFQRILQKISDSIYLIGPDTLRVESSGSSAGFNVSFVYGNGNTGIPIKGGDSIYTNPNLVGKNVLVYFNGYSSSSFVQDSITWTMLGSNNVTPYFRYNINLGQLTFCNMQNLSGLANGQFVVTIYGGDQGAYTNIDNNPTVDNSGSSQPGLGVSPSSLSGFTTVSGTQSAAQSFTVGGSNLTTNAIVTAPSGYLVSLNNSTFSSSVTIGETGGTISGTTVYAVLASSDAVGTYAENISVSSTGVSTQYVGISGTVSATPTLSLNATSLSAGTTLSGFMGSYLSFTVTGVNLLGNATVTAPAGYQVSLSSGTGYVDSLTLTPTSGLIPGTTVYVVLAASDAAGSPSGNITVSSTSAATQSIAITGTVTPAPVVTLSTSSLSGFSTTNGTRSATQSFTVSAINVPTNANVVITAPTNYQVSLNNSTFATTVVADPVSGTLATTTVYVAIASTAPIGSPSGNIVVSAEGATSPDVAVSGTVTGATSQTVSTTAISGMATIAGTQSSAQSFTVSGAYLTGSITITAPTGFLISLDNSTFAGTLTLPESGGTVASTTIYTVISSGASAGTLSGTMTLSTSGANTASISLAGTVYASGAIVVASNVSFIEPSAAYEGNQSVTPAVTTLIGANWTGNATVTAPTDFLVSLSSGSGYASSVTIPAPTSSNTVVQTPLYFVLASTAPPGADQEGTVAISGYNGSASQSLLTVEASVIGITPSTSTLSGFGVVSGSQSASQSFTYSSPLVTSAITITAPSGYLVSLNNSTFTTSVTTTTPQEERSGTVYVVLASTAPVGTVSGNVTLTNATIAVNVAVTGTVTN